MNIYREVSRLAKSRGMPIYVLEREAGLSNGTIRKWDESSPTVKNLSSVANVLGVKATTIIKRAEAEEENLSK